MQMELTNANTFLANIIMIFHILVIIFILLAPFSNNSSFLILHIIFAISLLTHWYNNNDLCSLTIENNSIYNINRTSDNNFSLYSITDDIELIDCEEKRTLSFSDIKKFIKIIDCIGQDTFELTINTNNIEYKSLKNGPFPIRPERPEILLPSDCLFREDIVYKVWGDNKKSNE